MRVRLDADRCDAWFDGKLVQLRPHEFYVLRALVENAGKYLTWQEIRRAVADWEEFPLPAVHEYTRVVIGQLRDRIGPKGDPAREVIRNKLNFGYMIELEDVEVCPTCGRRT